MASARFRRLALTDFRSYASAALDLDGRPVTLAGANGAGKTNILEAISLMGPGRGLRRARLDELPRAGGSGGWAVAARLDVGGDEVKLGVGAEARAPERRVCRINERAASGPSALSAHLRLLWLTPAQDRLFMEGAGERRRFLDRMALAHDPAHGGAANAYEKAMRQRQRLLEDGARDDAWLAALEGQMAEAGVAVAAARRDVAVLLASADIGAKVGVGAFPDAEIALDGALETALEHCPAADVEEDYAERLLRQRRADREAGRALMGPHRSDLIVSHRQKGQPARLCSTGEQKALLIGLVLANARALAERSGPTGGAPLVMLLDEIAAHLDADRRAALFDILDDIGFQTFMTGTDQSLFTAWGDRAQSFAIEDGAAVEIDNR
ncbi:MAG: DNA replication/repair protein RecF [Pseudomonadota bacterium]